MDINIEKKKLLLDYVESIKIISNKLLYIINDSNAKGYKSVLPEVTNIPEMPKVKPPKEDFDFLSIIKQALLDCPEDRLDARGYIKDLIKEIETPSIHVFTPERIIYAAILRSDNHILLGKQHSEIIIRSPYGTCKGGIVNGFLTNRGRFVDNIEAAKIAFDAYQLPHGYGVPKALFSEDLWSYKRGGKYDYDPKEGYILKENETEKPDNIN